MLGSYALLSFHATQERYVSYQQQLNPTTTTLSQTENIGDSVSYWWVCLYELSLITLILSV